MRSQGTHLEDFSLLNEKGFDRVEDGILYFIGLDQVISTEFTKSFLSMYA